MTASPQGQARSQAVFGGADGLTLALGLIVALSGQPHAIVKAALGAGLAELVGMSAGSYLSGGGYWPSAANGLAAFAACCIPAIPYAVAHGFPALTASLILVVCIAAVIARLRPERGLLAAAQTFGILLVAAAFCFAASLI